MEFLSNPLDYTKCADLMISRTKTFIYKCIFCRQQTPEFEKFVEHLPNCCPSILRLSPEENLPNNFLIKKTFVKNWKRKFPLNPAPPPPPRPLPPNFQEIADQQLQRTAPEVIQEQNKENVNSLKENRRKSKSQEPKDKNKEANPTDSLESCQEQQNITSPNTDEVSDQNIENTSTKQNENSTQEEEESVRLENEIQIMANEILQSSELSPKANEETPEKSSTSEIKEPEINKEQPEINTESITNSTPITSPPISETPISNDSTLISDNSTLISNNSSSNTPTHSEPSEVQEKEDRPSPFNIADLPIVVEIPMIKIERDAEMVPKLIEIEKLTIKQEVLSPVPESTPNPFDTEIIKENVMVQIPQANISSLFETEKTLLKAEKEPIPVPPQKKKRGRKKKNPESVEETSSAKKQKPDTQIQNTVKNTKKRKAETVPNPTKKTRTKKGRSKSLQELTSSSSSKHIRVKSPLELNDILKAKHNDLLVSKNVGKKIILGMKKGFLAAAALNAEKDRSQN